MLSCSINPCFRIFYYKTFISLRLFHKMIHFKVIKEKPQKAHFYVFFTFSLIINFPQLFQQEGILIIVMSGILKGLEEKLTASPLLLMHVESCSSPFTQKNVFDIFEAQSKTAWRTDSVMMNVCKRLPK